MSECNTKAEFLKGAREKLGLSQNEMAEKLGYSSYRTILQKEKGLRSVTKQDELLINNLLIIQNTESSDG